MRHLGTRQPGRVDTLVTQKNGDDDDDDNDDDENDNDDYWWRSPLPLAGPEELLWFVPFVDQSLRWTSHV